MQNDNRQMQNYNSQSVYYLLSEMRRMHEREVKNRPHSIAASREVNRAIHELTLPT